MARKPKTLVVGGTGFIGRHLVPELERTSEVRIVHTNPLRGVAPSSALYFRADARMRSSHLRELVAESDTVILLSQPDASIVRNVLDALPAEKDIRLVYASTSLLYRGGTEAQHEEGVLEAVTAYERAKQTEEEMVSAFAKKNSRIRSTIARLGNVYGGPGSRGLVGKAYDSIFIGGTMGMASRDTVRDFIFVDDVARALALLASRPQETSVDIVNVTTGIGHTVAEALALIGGIVGRDVPSVRTKGGRETKAVIGANGKLVRLVKFTPRMPFEKGLQATFERYEAHYRWHI